MQREVKTIYIHDTNEINDDGNTKEVPSINTYEEIDNREQLVDELSRIVDLDSLSNEVGKDIGEVLFVDGEIEDINLYYWVEEKYGL